MTARSPVLRSTTSASTRTPTPTRRIARHPAALLGVLILALTFLAAAASALWPQLGPARQPQPTLDGTPGEALSILAANLRTLIAPLLLTAGRWHTHRATRPVGDLLVAALVTANPILIGLALGRHPTELVAYLPHLPLEDAALAVSAAAWIARRLPSPDRRAPRSLLVCASLTLALVALAALLETYAVPHSS
jgi:hypothetical protein